MNPRNNIDELTSLPALELAARVRDKRLSPVEIMRSTISRIELVNPKLNCFCFTFFDEAMSLARDAERSIIDGNPIGPLHGVPIAIKDLTPTKD